MSLSWWLTLGALLCLVFTLSGCAVTGELPVCTSGCTLQKSWGF